MALEHFKVVEEGVCHGYGLGTLQMGVAGDDDGLGAFCEGEEFAHGFAEGVVEGFAMIFEPEAHVGGDLVVAAAGSVELGGGGFTLCEGVLDVRGHLRGRCPIQRCRLRFRIEWRQARRGWRRVRLR